MMLNATISILTLSLVFLFQSGCKLAVQSPDPIIRLVQVADCEDFWVQVHAIEYLSATGNRELSADLIDSKIKMYDQVPRKRIGVWRASFFADSTRSKNSPFVQKILAAYLDTAGPDRIHAAESLAKIKFPMSRLPAQILNRDLDDPGMMASFVRWGKLNPEDPATQPGFADLLFQLNDSVPENRKLAAYGLSFLGNQVHRYEAGKYKSGSGIQDQEWRILAKAALKEDSLTQAYPYMLGVAYSLYDYEKDPFGDLIFIIRERLLALRYRQDKNARIELCRALAIHSRIEDKNILQSLLNLDHPITRGGEEEPISKNHPFNKDVQASAAYALLCHQARFNQT